MLLLFLQLLLSFLSTEAYSIQIYFKSGYFYITICKFRKKYLQTTNTIFYLLYLSYFVFVSDFAVTKWIGNIKEEKS